MFYSTILNEDFDAVHILMVSTIDFGLDIQLQFSHTSNTTDPVISLLPWGTRRSLNRKVHFLYERLKGK